MKMKLLAENNVGSLKSKLSTMALAMVIGGIAFASGNLTIAVAEHEEFGPYLTDSAGMSLYLFLPDERGESTCDDECAEAWPPLTTEADGESVAAGEGVDAELLGVVQRSEDVAQVTYNDWPLYHYAQDADAGDIQGQGIGESWFLVSPSGEPIGADGSAQGANGENEEVAQLIQEGETLFDRGADPTPCADCHGQDGNGRNGPPIRDSHIVRNADRFIRRILNGGQLMPGFARGLSDREVAAVATYVRTSFGYDLGPISVEDVREQRR